eukprot:CAMPEP_0113709308 /NCGR_PEP_ID=MMETSP0038_2-20120614/29493_1 /TAXON_ID=2898 /ORGANISM="Cryptomonas paramecium" /LENGTH=37 /DNA_ID=CAMNT_0000635167 /DNA_START=699 /DNA_END=808 /DNA_ORIENTATION=+ /assembly_acc=CAM_ASM_000170
MAFLAADLEAASSEKLQDTPVDTELGEISPQPSPPFR